MKNFLDRARRNRYVLTAIAANAVIWIMALGHLLLFPNYTVQWSFILPTSDMDARVEVHNAGQAYATARSPYDAKSLDPRVNYRTIMLSDTVLQSAAARIPMAVEKFVKPRIRLIDQSSVMEFWISADSPELAHAKARALVAAFEQRINELRADEGRMRDAGIEESIRASRSKLEAAQAELIRFKVRSRIVSPKQLDDAVLRMSALQQQQSELRSKLAHGGQFVLKMASSLSAVPDSAGLTLALQSDAGFMASFERYTAATAELAEVEHKWGPKHPQVQSLQGRAGASFEALAARARRILGKDVSDAQIKALAIASAARGPEPLVRELVAQNAELKEVRRQLAEQNAKLDNVAQQFSELDDLERRVKLAEAVFHSAIGKIEVGKSNIFSSYPLVQAMVEPAPPKGRSKRATLFVLLGAMAGSMLLTTALTLAWIRRKGV